MKPKIKRPRSKAKFIPCDEFSQIYTWHKTNKNPKLNRTK
tara:strand:- start:5290 stop:5409 length:120 start_codon:yes stop_codon:yes gene_type:complete